MPNVVHSDRPTALEYLGPSVLRLALKTYTLPPATTTNHYLIGDQHAALVDPATPEKKAQDQLLEHVRRWSRKVAPVQALILTHHHNDHIGAANRLSRTLNLPVWAHRATAELLVGRVEVHRYLVDGDVVAQDERGPWVAWHTPGHAPGHLAICGPHREVLVGDLLAGQGSILIDPDEGHMGQYLHSLKRILDSDPLWIGPAHGRVIDEPKSAIEAYINHRLARQQRVLDSLPSDVPAVESELVQQVYDDTPQLLWPLARRSLRAHLLWLAEQGLAREHKDTSWTRLVETRSSEVDLGD